MQRPQPPPLALLGSPHKAAGSQGPTCSKLIHPGGGTSLLQTLQGARGTVIQGRVKVGRSARQVTTFWLCPGGALGRCVRGGVGVRA